MTKILKNEIFFSEIFLKKSSCYTNFLRFTTIKFSGNFFFKKIKCTDKHKFFIFLKKFSTIIVQKNKVLPKFLAKLTFFH
jgi:hypothetical protein